MQLALGVKTGDIDKSEVSQDVVDAAESMSKNELEKYAKEPVEERLRWIVREEVDSLLNEDHLSEDELNKLDETIHKFLKHHSLLRSAVYSIRKIYGKNGKYSENVNKFSGSVLSKLGSFSKQFGGLKELLKDEYPEYNWSFE